ncbi:MAG: ASKHA domain-containing protein [Treponema sp.]|nr:ASKHA domain-containing protein [Treponema sp.]
MDVPEMEFTISLYALRKLPQDLRGANFKVECVIRKETDGKRCILNLYPASFLGDPASADNGTQPSVYEKAPRLTGLAIDIGTTTVSMLLIDLETGNMISSGSAGNGQIRYGADVITRIIESVRPGGVERLCNAVTEECTEPLIHRLCDAAGITPNRIYRVAVAANTTMIHLFLGVSAEHLRLEPYVPAFFESKIIRGKDLGMSVNPEAEVLIAPSIGSYVGGDITAGVFSSMIFRKETPSLFIDLGTNGELVFGSTEFLFGCACSAGPAFEGGDISCGMRATDGAVEACQINPDTMEPAMTVVGAISGQKPAGICGSGLIDMIGELFRGKIINAKGKFIKEGRRIKRDEYGVGRYVAAFAEDTESGREVALTETDIDNFIRAKGAIFSAIKTMLSLVDYPVEAIEDVYVAGGIGSGINMGQAIRIGMFPNLPLKKFHYIGNSSMLGAYAMTSSRKAADMVTQISRGITYLELSSHPGYMDEFVAACFLPHTDAGLFQYHEE